MELLQLWRAFACGRGERLHRLGESRGINDGGGLDFRVSIVYRVLIYLVLAYVVLHASDLMGLCFFRCLHL